HAIIGHPQSPATSSTNREHPQDGDALVTRLFRNFLPESSPENVNSYVVAAREGLKAKVGNTVGEVVDGMGDLTPL
ncbi:MAG TPA: hypothetical protein VNF71_10670, partial [Acidimicrobiales bacterium]|nr:hypothetical protein [Acidimicrobiales bacterium]